MIEKKNPDYTESAVNLTNPPEVIKAMGERESFASHIANLKALLEAYPEWEELRKAEQRLTDHDQLIRKLIDNFGSYQDTERGIYGLKQIRKTITFLAEKIREVIPAFAEAVIDGVKKTQMNGLITGGLITQEQANKCSQTEVSYAYIIK